MKIAQSFKYRGVPVLILTSNISNISTIYTDKSVKTYNCVKIDLLKELAISLVDKEIDGDLFNNSFKLRNNVPC